MVSNGQGKEEGPVLEYQAEYQAIRTLVLPFPQFQSGKAKDSTPRAMWSPLPRRGEAIERISYDVG